MTAPSLYLNGTARIGNTPVFGPLSFAANGGEWTCLLGASGVGKSTLLRLIAGLDTGVDFNGTLGADEGDLAGNVTFMAQDDLLLPRLSARDNVLIGARLRGERPDYSRAVAVLEQVGLSEHLAKKPSQLSGGQRQRVALARTLMEDRPIVLLDEPFSALDALTRSQMQDLTAKLLRGRTVLLVTHDPGEAARLGHRILIMTQGALDEVPVPKGTVPRAWAAPEVLAVQAELLTRLRGVAA